MCLLCDELLVCPLHPPTLGVFVIVSIPAHVPPQHPLLRMYGQPPSLLCSAECILHNHLRTAHDLIVTLYSSFASVQNTCVSELL